MTFTLTIDGLVTESKADERLVDLINRVGAKLPQVCYHPQLGPIQSCDTCMVEVDGRLVRACATKVSPGMDVSTRSTKAVAAQREAFDRILGNHMLYCTVCDNNNGNCTVHNTTRLMAVEHQKIPFKTSRLQLRRLDQRPADPENRAERRPDEWHLSITIWITSWNRSSFMSARTRTRRQMGGCD